jgi:hypothetical protein
MCTCQSIIQEDRHGIEFFGQLFPDRVLVVAVHVNARPSKPFEVDNFAEALESRDQPTRRDAVFILAVFIRLDR